MFSSLDLVKIARANFSNAKNLYRIAESKNLLDTHIKSVMRSRLVMGCTCIEAAYEMDESVIYIALQLFRNLIMLNPNGISYQNNVEAIMTLLDDYINPIDKYLKMHERS